MMKKALLSFVKFLLLIIAIATLFAVAGNTLIKEFGVEKVGHFHAHIESLAWVFFVFRICLYTMVLYFYPQVTHWFAKRQGMNKAETSLLQDRRLNMAAWLLGFEVVVALPYIVRVIT